MSERRAVVVSTKTGLDIRGVLREQTGELLVLAAASVAGEEGGRTTWKPLVGDTVIPMSNVDYWQRALPAEFVASMTLGGVLPLEGGPG
jgi:hypothetical protein